MFFLPIMEEQIAPPVLIVPFTPHPANQTISNIFETCKTFRKSFGTDLQIPMANRKHCELSVIIDFWQIAEILS